MIYRRDIDGLRSLAVLPVVLFHAHVAGFDGGYVGVDIFFVISGYLITSILAKDIDAGRFSLVTFYERRIRRIFPALFVLLLAVLVGGVAILLPSFLRELPGTVIGTLLFVSNIIFWMKSGYFSGDSEQKPLLHTWSLGVEEQFYIFFPVILFLLARYAPRYRLPVVAAMAVASLVACIVLTKPYPDASFYLIHTRAWELFAGSLLALGAVPQIRSPMAREVVSLAGAAAILVAIFSFTDQTPFPGYAALLPVLGSVALLHSAPGTLVGRLLSMRLPVAIGLISYSLYLWHWPIVVYGRFLGLFALGAAGSAIIVGLSLAAATLSYFWVEQPFRKKDRVGRARLFVLAAVGALILVAGSAALWVKHGWPERFAASTVAYDNGRYDVSPQRGRCHRDEGHDRPLDRSCVLGAGASKAVLWGDSHGVELARALAVGDHAITQITYSHCPPAIGFDDPYRAGCKAHNQRVADWIAAQPIDTVVLAMRYHTYQDAPGFFQGLDRTIAMLRHAGKTVRIIGPVPFPGFDVPTHLANGGAPAISRAAWEAADRDTLNWLARNVPSDIAVLRPSDTLCNRTSCALARDGRSLYFDANHLTLFAARRVTREFWQNSTNALSRSGKNM